MSLFSRLFPKTSVALATAGYFETLTSYQPRFTSFNGGIYEASMCRAAIHAYASHCSKLDLQTSGAAGSKIQKILNKPNAWQTTSQFLYQLATVLECDNTAFIFPELDNTGESIIALHVVRPSCAEVVRMPNGEAWLKVRFAHGKTAVVEFSRVGILTKFQYANEFFGTADNALYPTLQLIHTQNEGIMEGVKNGATIRFMAKLAQALKSEDIAKERERFVSQNLSLENSGGVMMYDAKYSDVKQIESKPFTAGDEQMKLINENVYDFFGINKEIIQNKYDDAQWNAYYEGKIEPFAIQLSQVLTNLFYTEHQEAFNNYIFASTNRLQYASVSTKLQAVTQLFDRGMLTTNQGCDVFQLPHVEGGDKRYIRKEYAEIDKLNEAQGLALGEGENNE